MWKYEGVGFNLFGGIRSYVQPQALFRYWNPIDNNHFYTTNEDEVKDDENYIEEGHLGYCSQHDLNGSLKPLYRYYHTRGKNHFYTTNIKELGAG